MAFYLGGLISLKKGLTFTIAVLFAISLAPTLQVSALALSYPYPTPFIILNNTVGGTPVAAGNKLYIIALNGTIYSEGKPVFTLKSSISAFDYDHNSSAIAIGTVAGEIVVVRAGSEPVYMQAHEPVNGIWFLDDGRRVAVFTGSRVLVYEVGKNGWLEISPYKTSMVAKHVPFLVYQVIVGEKPGHGSGSLIAVIGRPLATRKLMLHLVQTTTGGTVPAASVNVEVYVPEYGFTTTATSDQKGLVTVDVPVPAKAVYLVIRVGDQCSLLVIRDFKNSTQPYNYGTVALDQLAWGSCPEFRGVGVVLFNSSLAMVDSVWVPVEGFNLLSLFESRDRLVLLGYNGNRLVVVVKEGGEQHTYTYMLPAKPTSAVISPDSKIIVVGCENGEIFVINATTMKFIRASLVGLGEVMSMDVALVGDQYLIATYDAGGRVSISVLTRNSILLSAYVDLGSLSRPFPHVQFWQDELLASGRNGYVVIYGVDKLVRPFGDMFKRIVKDVTIRTFGENGEPVKAEVAIYYNGKHVATITTPSQVSLLVGLNYTFIIKPLQDHYEGLKTRVHVGTTTDSVDIKIPYKVYNLTILVHDPYGVQEPLKLYVDGNFVATLAPGGNTSKTSILLKYGYHSLAVVGEQIYPMVKKEILLDGNRTISIDLTRLDGVLTLVFSEKPREPLVVKVIYANRTAAVRECLEQTCALRAPRGYNATIVVEPIPTTYPYYLERMIRGVTVLEESLVNVKLVPRKYPLSIVLKDDMGRIVCPVKVYLNNTLVGTLQPENPTITVNITKGVYSVRVEGSVGRAYVYKQEVLARVNGPTKVVLNLTRLYTPIRATIIDSLTGGGPAEKITLSSGNFSLVVDPSQKPVNVTVFVLLEKPVIVVKGSTMYSPQKFGVNTTLGKVLLKLNRRIATVQVTVVNEKGEPLYAMVEVRGVGLAYSSQMRTVDGKALFTAPVGVYQVCAEAQFYTSHCTEVNLAVQQVVTITLYPTPIAIVLRNLELIIAFIVIVGALLAFYKMRSRIIEKILGTEEEELF